MREIKINNSKLKIVELNYGVGKDIVSFNKAMLKYQFVVFTNPVVDKISPVRMKTVIGLSRLHVDKLTMSEYDKCWALEVGKNIPNYIGNEYSIEDLKVISSILYVTVSEFFDTSELLSLSTRDEKIIQRFYRSYGKEGILEFKNYLRSSVINNSKYVPRLSKEEIFPVNYLRNKYSIQSLISDLVQDKASILINEYVVGKVSHISKKKEDSTGNLVKEESVWYELAGVVGNKTRANLSLRYLKDVSIPIPKNEFGIDEGIMNLKSPGSICLIKDGILWQKRLGVKISPKLAGKLKRLKVVSSELLNPGEYLLDLTTIPVISKSYIRKITSQELAGLEVNYMLSKIALEFLDYISDKPKISDKEMFLRKLGIVNNMYLPEKSSKESDDSYNTVEIITSFSGIPKTYSERERVYYSLKNNIRIEDSVVSVFLNKVFPGKKDCLDCFDNIEKLKKSWKEEYNKLSLRLRDRKFQIIMSKDTRFNEKGYPFIDTIDKKIDIMDFKLGKKESVTVSWKFKTSKIYI